MQRDQEWFDRNVAPTDDVTVPSPEQVFAAIHEPVEWERYPDEIGGGAIGGVGTVEDGCVMCGEVGACHEWCELPGLDR